MTHYKVLLTICSFLGQKIDILVLPSPKFQWNQWAFKPISPSVIARVSTRVLLEISCEALATLTLSVCDCVHFQATIGGQSDRPESGGELWSIRHAAEPARGSHLAPLRPARHPYP